MSGSSSPTRAPLTPRAQARLIATVGWGAKVNLHGLVGLLPSYRPPRKVYSLNAQGQEYLEEFWRAWSFLAERLEQLHEGGK
jgi:hypothetical protein